MSDLQQAEDVLLKDLNPLLADMTTKRKRVEELQQKTDLHVKNVLSDVNLLTHTIGLILWAKDGLYAQEADKDEHALNFISQEVDRLWKGNNVSFQLYAKQAESEFATQYNWLTRPSIPAHLTQMLVDTKSYQTDEIQYQDEKNTKEQMQSLALRLTEKEKSIERTLKNALSNITGTLRKNPETDTVGRDLEEIRTTNAKLAELQPVAERILLHLTQKYNGAPTAQLITDLTACTFETASLLAQKIDFYNNPDHYTVPEVVAEQSAKAVEAAPTSAPQE